MFDVYNHLAVFGIIWVVWLVFSIDQDWEGVLPYLVYPLSAAIIVFVVGEVFVWSVYTLVN